jgi:diguanylate cyclase (GGDEF)-like protein
MHYLPETTLFAKVKNDLTLYLYPNLLSTIPSLIILAVVLVFRLKGSVNPVSLGIWLGVFLMATLAQGALYAYYHYTKERANMEPLYYKLLLANVAVIGSLWGVASLLLMPADFVSQSYLMIIVAFVAAGGPLYLAGSFLAGSLYVTCSLAPLIIALTLSSFTGLHHEVYFNIAIAMTTYWIVLMSMSYYGSKLFTNNFMLSLENDILLEDLESATQSLEQANAPVRTAEEIQVVTAHHPVSNPETYFDELTNLDTQPVAEIKFIQSAAFAKRHHQSLAVVCIDITNMNDVIAQWGQEAGLSLMKTASVRLKYCKRETDILFRLTDNQFLLVISEVLLGNEIMTVTSKIQKLFNEKVLINDKDLHIESRMGVCVYPGDGVDLPTLIDNAETALSYNTSENPVQFYDPEIMAKSAVGNRVTSAHE